MKNICGILLSLLLWCNASAQSTGDTIHVIHYSITIDTIDYVSKSIRANTVVRVQSKLNNVPSVSLALLHFTIDSIQSASVNLPYSYTDTVLHIAPATTLQINDSIDITVYYHGQPQADPSGWGGFYFNGAYAFNLGVGFASNPHNFGRCLFPCIDEFSDKSTYSFHITTANGYKAFCNGTLQGVTDLGNGTQRWDWNLADPMCSYLAGLAVAPFYTIHRTYSGIPYEMGVMPGDSAATIASFANVGTAISTFIADYGPYPWEKIGYVMTPVTYGGMENASSIHISKVFVDGSLSYETLFMHELSHMWWGDKVTCKTEKDMWLNEGFATFNEHVFTEAQYGQAAYKTSFHADHRDVLQFAHIDDAAYYALNDVPHDYTYATLSVYKKGAHTAHTLRKYMGDAKFFQACRDYMSHLAYGNASSNDMRDQFAASSGMNLDDFFTDWVFTPGFPHFAIDSFSVEPSGINYNVKLHTKQKRKGATHTSKMLVEFNFSDGVNDSNMTLLCDANVNEFHLTLPFSPQWISVDRNEKMMDALTDFEMQINSTGNKIFTETNMTANVIAVGSGASTVRVEHNFVPPDEYVYNPGIRVSDYHYWKVDGLLANGFYAKATFFYDGRLNNSTGYLDNTLITGTEDSLVILYRPGAGYDWKPVNGFTRATGTNHTDKTGNFVIDTLKKGEYTFGYFDVSVRGIKEHVSKNESLHLLAYPNPSGSLFTISFQLPYSANGSLRIFDLNGKQIRRSEIFSHQNSIVWDSYGFPPGVYIAEIETSNGHCQSIQLIKSGKFGD